MVFMQRLQRKDTLIIELHAGNTVKIEKSTVSMNGETTVEQVMLIKIKSN